MLPPSTTTTTATSAAVPRPHTHHHSPLPMRSMEEVWQDINLSTLHDNPPSSAAAVTSPSFRSIILQDFLSRPSTTSTSAALPAHSSPPPATALSLNSVPDFIFPTHHHQSPRRHDAPASDVCDAGPFDSLASTVLASFGKKRFPSNSNGAPGDRRHKRMIKNRESAARSRARKQAYINELELEVAHLMEENARLREQQQKQMQQVQPALLQPPKRHHQLQRTSTAPF